MEDGGYIDLLTLQLHAGEALEEAFPERIWVRAEIASLSVKPNGHCYLELAQSDEGQVVAKARAVVWKGRWPMLSAFFESVAGTPLSAGIEVLVRVQVTYSEIWGFSLTIDDINPEFTLGGREKARQETIRALEEEGLMDLQKELALPDLPYSLAIISAQGAAGLGDFLHHLHGNEYGFRYRTRLFEAVMQGKEAPRSVADALAEVEGSGDRFDAVLVMRGGGSDLDLACFDDYLMCSAIARCPVPVFTAIGHDRDYHVADMVANTFVKTPTALADLFIEATAAEDERISSYRTRLSRAFTGRIHALEMGLDAVWMKTRNASANRLDAADSALRLLETKISATDPRNVLRRGFSLVLDQDGIRMTGAEGRSPGDRLSVVFSDGRIGAVIDTVIKESQVGD